MDVKANVMAIAEAIFMNILERRGYKSFSALLFSNVRVLAENVLLFNQCDDEQAKSVRSLETETNVGF